MRLVLLLIITYLMVSSSPLSSNIIRVPADSSTIQTGIMGAVDGDTVLVADGTYTGDGNRDIRFLGKAILVMSENGAESCIIDCEGNPEDEHRGFYFFYGEDTTSILRGFTIKNAWINGNGGGICCVNSSPTIENNIIEQNTTQGSGGGIGCTFSAAIIRNNYISGNQTHGSQNYHGAGIYCLGVDSATTIIEGNTIIGNISHMRGGGIACYGDNILIRRNTIRLNSASSAGGINCQHHSKPIIIENVITWNYTDRYDGGGILCDSDSSPIIQGNIISWNSALRNGGGIFCYSSSPLIINNTITRNSAYEQGGGFYSRSAASSYITNTILWNNEAPLGQELYLGDSYVPSDVIINYSNVDGGLSSVFVDSGGSIDWGLGMMETDPRFRNSSEDNYYLSAIVCGDMSDSPCIDAGNPAYVDSILDCTWGLGTITSDMGAYGGGRDVVGVDNDNSSGQLPKSLTLHQNYPNPFNPITTITFVIPSDNNERQLVLLTIYDIRGRLVNKLINSKVNPGKHTVQWDGKNVVGHRVPSGIYFYKLKCNDIIEVKKMIVQK